MPHHRRMPQQKNKFGENQSKVEILPFQLYQRNWRVVEVQDLASYRSRWMHIYQISFLIWIDMIQTSHSDHEKNHKFCTSSACCCDLIGQSHLKENQDWIEAGRTGMVVKLLWRKCHYLLSNCLVAVLHFSINLILPNIQNNLTSEINKDQKDKSRILIWGFLSTPIANFGCAILPTLRDSLIGGVGASPA